MKQRIPATAKQALLIASISATIVGCGQNVAYRTEQNEIRYGVLNGVNLEQEQRVASPTDIRRFGPSYSPNGDKVAYLENARNLVIEDVQSGARTVHDHDDLKDYADRMSLGSGARLPKRYIGGFRYVAWHPSDDKILLEAQSSAAVESMGSFGMVLDLSSKSVQRVPGYEGQYSNLDPRADWEPTGKEIVFEKRDDLLAAEPGASSARLIERNASQPAWGKAGIAFIRNGDLFIKKGGSVTQLTQTTGVEMNPRFVKQANTELLFYIREDAGQKQLRYFVAPFNGNKNSVMVNTDKQAVDFDLH